MKDVEVDTNLILAPARSRIRYEPLGVALIFGSWNFPYFVTIGPLTNAIAAGNLAVIKPSEMAPASSFKRIGDLAEELWLKHHKEAKQ